VQPNPLNPRYSLDDAEVVELADTLRRVGQLRPALVVGRDQFLHAYHDQAPSLGSQPWVVIVGNRQPATGNRQPATGNRRLAACRVAGRPALDVRVAADLDTPEDLLTGLVLGVVQAIALPRHTRLRWAWATALPLLWALGWTVTTLAMVGVDEQFTVFGATGAVTFSALSGLLLHRLLRGPADASADRALTATAATS
jgi:hypothetical protein